MTVNELLVKFREDYRAAQPEPVRDIEQGIPDNDFGALSAKALDLEGRGFAVDLHIDLWRWEPLWVHMARNGEAVESFNGGAKKLPGVFVDLTDPEGTLARLHAAYPLPAPPPVVHPSQNPIGVPFGVLGTIQNGQIMFGSGLPVWQCLAPGFSIPNGQEFTAATGRFLKFIQGGENISHSALHLWLGPIAG